jgi:paired small multidrug resistance pump
MAWIFLILAGAFEVLGVTMINQYNRKQQVFSLVILITGFGASFLFLALAMETLPMSTAYAIWTGIGTSGGAILGMILYGESRDWQRIFFIMLVLGSAIGLKITS